MKKSIRMFAVGLAAVALSFHAGTARAAEIKVLSTIGVQSATPEIVAQFERASGHKVTVTYGIAAVLRTRYLNGEAADVVILTKSIIEDLMKQNVAPVASLHDFVRRRRVAGNHDPPVLGVEAIPERILPGAMFHRKRRHGDVFVAIHDSRLNLMHVDFVSGCVRLLEPPQAQPHIFRPGFLDVCCHALEPAWPVSFKWLRPFQHPRSKNQVGIPERVVGMQMRDKHNLQVVDR